MKVKICKPLSIHELGKRENQEDSIYPMTGEASVDSRLFVLCDGMGGHEHGELASQLVCKVLANYLGEHWKHGEVLADSDLQDALDEVFRQIDTLDDGSVKQMGTTLTLLCFHRGGATMAHIGDSRIYHIRPRDGRILYKSRDHSFVYDLFITGEITQEEMATYPKKNIITRAIMPRGEQQHKADIVHSTDIQEGDFFFLCSDGMLEQMSDGELVELLMSGMTDKKIRQRLIDATKDNKDNHSAWLVRVAEVESENDDDLLPHDESTARCNAMKWEKQPTVTRREPSFWEKVKNVFN